MALTITENVYPWVGHHEVFKHGQVQEDLLVVDVRTSAEYAEIHIPGSWNVPLADLPHCLEDVRARAAGKSVVLMCRTQNRAKLAYDQLRLAGMEQCLILEGGMVKWAEAHLPVLHGAKTVSLERQVRMAAGALIVVGFLLGIVIHPGWHVLPAMVGVGLFYAGLTDSCMMGMLLARLPFNRRA